MLSRGNETAFYLDGELVDTVMLDYQAQRNGSGARIHKRRQAVCKLRYIAYELFNGYSNDTTEEIIKKWIGECYQ